MAASRGSSKQPSSCIVAKQLMPSFTAVPGLSSVCLLKPLGQQSKDLNFCSEYDLPERLHCDAYLVSAANQQCQRPMQLRTRKVQSDTPTAATLQRCRRTLRNSRLARLLRAFCCGSMKQRLGHATTYLNVISQNSKMQIVVKTEKCKQSTRLVALHALKI